MKSIYSILCLAFLLGPGPVCAGSVKDLPDGTTVVTVECWRLPDKSRTDTLTKADVAVLREFVRRWMEGWEETLPDGTVKRHPSIYEQRYRARYEADPATYGRHDWSKVELRLDDSWIRHKELKGTDMRGVGQLAMEKGKSADVVYVTFRHSDAYIKNGFLYPLDKPEDGYLSAMTKEERDFAIHGNLWPVIKRRGPEGNEHVWAMPFGGVLGRVMLYRKDLLDGAGIPYPTNEWTWEDFLVACKKLTNPAEGTYGVRFGRGNSESWFWTSFLWSAGGEVQVHDAERDEWRFAFDSRAAAVALEFYNRLCCERWVDGTGRERRGYAFREPEGGAKWSAGEIGFWAMYINDRVLGRIDPEVTGMVALPWGYPDRNGKRHRGGELNCRLFALSSSTKSPVVRDAAWEYIRFYESKDAVRIRIQAMVDGGLGRLVNPRYLRLFGHEELVAQVPKGWEEAYKIAIATGKAAPHGRNCMYAYYLMTKPINKAEELARKGKLPTDWGERLALLRVLLRQAVAEANAWEPPQRP